MKKLLMITLLLVSITTIGCSKSTRDNEGSAESVVADIQNKENEELEEIEQENVDKIEDDIQEAEVLEERENTTFRNCVWGDDFDTVKKYEDAELLGETNDTLLYKGSVNSMDTSIIYYFDKDGRLYRGGYLLDQKANGGEYIRDYNILRSSLVEKYGEPLHGNDDIIKYQKDSLIERAGESKALEYGYVAYSNQWETEETQITIGLTTNNYKTTFLLAYTDKNYKAEENNDI